MIKVYLLVLLQKFKISLEGIRLLCLGLWKKNVIHGIFRWIEYKYGGSKRTQDRATLGGGFVVIYYKFITD